MRRRYTTVVWVLLAVVAIPILWTSVVLKPDVTQEHLLEQRLLDLRERLQHAENLYNTKDRDLAELKSQFEQRGRQLLKHPAQAVRDAGYSKVSSPLRFAASHVTENISLISKVGKIDGHLFVPSLYSHLPHVPEGPIKPAFSLSQHRIGVSMVYGVPTVKRPKESYLIRTLTYLVNGLPEEERKDALIIVFVAEPWDLQYIEKVASEVHEALPGSVNAGLIEVIGPPENFYPDMNTLRITLGDSHERVRWRTKQNLDFAFLMLYAKSLGLYYTQLEDDIIAKPGYQTVMKNFALRQKTDEWLLLEFSQLGFIGKMFKTQDLALLGEFFLMFHNDKPVDWLLDHLLYTKYCSPEKSVQHCRKIVAEVRRRYKPSLFQHVGIHSSLKGKVQKLKDRDFGKQVNMLLTSHHNPPAEVKCTLTVYQKYSLDRAYTGESIFWGLNPEPDDSIEIVFRQPVVIEKFLLRSGNPEHPGDRFFNTTIEVLPSSRINDNGAIIENQPGATIYPEGENGYLIVGSFNAHGIADGVMDERLGPIAVLKLHVLSKSPSWVILSEISIATKKTR